MDNITSVTEQLVEDAVNCYLFIEMLLISSLRYSILKTLITYYDQGHTYKN